VSDEAALAIGHPPVRGTHAATAAEDSSFGADGSRWQDPARIPGLSVADAGQG